MIVVKLFGGIGNQMFQYAAGRRAAIVNGVPLAFDLRWFGVQGLRVPELDGLQIDRVPDVDVTSLPHAAAGWTGARRTHRLGTSIVARARGWRLVAEKVPGVFQQRVLLTPDRSYLVGYWQSERYFSDVTPQLRREMKPRLSLPTTVSATAADIRASQAVSLHVRRGDYASPAGAAHGTLSRDYYRAAMDLLDEKLAEPVYFAFSDDPLWVSENLRHPRLRLLSGAASAGPLPDLALMSACRSHIVANSSFSWWGAWLGDDPAKEVVAPARWFADPSWRSDDIVPDGWHRV